MKKANSFYAWFTSLGGDVKKIEVSQVFETLNKVDVQVSSFKHRAQEIKDKYNYKFHCLSNDFINGHPDITKLDFQPK